jgi:NADPH2:quinone reductase
MTTRARAVRFDQYGGTEVLHVAEVDVPGPEAGEVLVAVRAAGINPGEASIRQGYMDSMFPATFPSGEGSDLAGVVAETGDGVDAFSTGDEVLGWTDRRGSHAEYVVVPGDHLVAKPATVGWEVAGSLFVVGATAYAAVRAVGAGPGDTVVVSAAAGGVGSVAVQLLKVRGASVIGIASEANHSWLSSVGVTPVAYGAGLIERIRAAAPSGVDAFVDTFGEDYVKLAIDLGVEPERVDTIIAFEAAEKYGAQTKGSSDGSSADVLAELVDLVASGRITVPIAATYPLDQVREAYAELAKRHTRGKIVLIP